MSLDFNRYVAQKRCEVFCNCEGDLTKWQSSRKIFETLSLSPAQSMIYSNDLRLDSVYLYKKGIHSLFNTIKGLEDESLSYSWATVMLYYSVHYFLRSTLAANGIGVIRNGSLYFLNDNIGSVPQRKTGRNYNTTHGGVIYYTIDKYSASDVLLSNEIRDQKTYVWFKEIREIINYRQNEFSEPIIPELWLEIDSEIDRTSIEQVINNYIEDEDFLYCFQDDHALLALPIKKAFLTKQNLNEKGIKLELDEPEIAYFTERVTNTQNGQTKTGLVELFQ